jgi:acyl dehydratase
MPIMLKGLEGIRAHTGFHLGKSQWICVTEEMISAFSMAIDQREDVQVSDARIEAPPDAITVAHGFHTLSLVIPLLQDVFLLEDVSVGEHYGVNHLRFSAPVPLNSSVRLSVKLAAAELSDDAVHMSLECTMECDASRDPVLYTELLFRYLPYMQQPAPKAPMTVTGLLRAASE